MIDNRGSGGSGQVFAKAYISFMARSEVCETSTYKETEIFIYIYIAALKLQHLYKNKQGWSLSWLNMKS